MSQAGLGPLDPAVAAGRVAVRHWLEQAADGAKAGLVARGDPAGSVPAARQPAGTPAQGGTQPLVLVACSGGADSLALAASAAVEAPRAGWRAGAVVVDHGLLEGSGGVAGRAADQCRSLGLEPVVVRRVEVDRADPAGLEAAARQARYQALRAVAGELGAQAVLLGHTMDDQAETVLLALARGSGARALAGMPPARGVFARPFLELRRSATEAICRALGLAPWQDPTNLPGGPYTSVRAAVRAAVIPAAAEALGPGVVPALARTAAAVRQDLDYLDAQAAELFRAAAALTAAAPGAPPSGAALSLQVKPLAQAHPAVRHRALHQAALAW
ncbi:MAG: tRNA lysidine(34) synthetase TilS, partial [Bifidobacteriaceae bacterium]|nr:tRNA lysidine(34) synthetase TilS [Bifidobacteriaceae bacterium]